MLYFAYCLCLFNVVIWGFKAINIDFHLDALSLYLGSRGKGVESPPKIIIAASARELYKLSKILVLAQSARGDTRSKNLCSLLNMQREPRIKAGKMWGFLGEWLVYGNTIS